MYSVSAESACVERYCVDSPPDEFVEVCIVNGVSERLSETKEAFDSDWMSVFEEPQSESKLSLLAFRWLVLMPGKCDDEFKLSYTNDAERCLG